MIPNVTLIVCPHERFSCTRESLESIFQYTTIPFELIYVDAGSPKSVQTYLQKQSQMRNFQLIRTKHYLSPNQARNLAIPHVKTKYVLFMGNDVIVSPQWLERLLACAEETNAAIASPLICVGKPLHQTIYLAGGEAHIRVEASEHGIHRKVHEERCFANCLVAEVRDQLYRQECELAEFHCMLVRTDVFEKTGLLDEKLLSAREHLDFCLTVTAVGETVFCEPSSVVTYVPGLKFEWLELSFFFLRWSDAWEISSLKHFRQKWHLSGKDTYHRSSVGHRKSEPASLSRIRLSGVLSVLNFLAKPIAIAMGNRIKANPKTSLNSKEIPAPKADNTNELRLTVSKR